MMKRMITLGFAAALATVGYAMPASADGWHRGHDMHSYNKHWSHSYRSHYRDPRVVIRFAPPPRPVYITPSYASRVNVTPVPVRTTRVVYTTSAPAYYWR